MTRQCRSLKRWAFILPTISVTSWLAMLGSLLASWFISGQPRYTSEEDTQTIAFISDIGAQRLKPVFIICTSVTMITYIPSLILYFYQMRPTTNTLSPSSSESMIHVNYSLPSTCSILSSQSSSSSRSRHRRQQQERSRHHSLILQISIPLLSILFSLIGATTLILLTIFDTARYTTVHQMLLPTSISAHILGSLILCIWTAIRLRQYRDLQTRTKYSGGSNGTEPSIDKFTLELHTPRIPISTPSLVIKAAVVVIELGLATFFALLTWWLKSYDNAAVIEWVVVLMFAGYMMCLIVDLWVLASASKLDAASEEGVLWF